MPEDMSLDALNGKLKETFKKGSPRVQSTAKKPGPDRRLSGLLIPIDQRGKMPLTSKKFLVKESEHLIQWERETRRFLRKLSPLHEHRVSAVMVWEWATGLNLKEVMAAGPARNPPGVRSWRADMRAIGKVLRYYYGDPYATYIAGRKVPKAYKIRQGYYITRHRPMTLSLWVEYIEGTLRDE